MSTSARFSGIRRDWLRGLLGVALLTGGCTVAPSPKPLASAPNTITVRDFEMAPMELAINAGATVTWRFEGPTPHSTTANADSKVAWDSGVMSPGASFSVKFDAPGIYSYHCNPHPFMTGKIIVK